MLLFFFQVEKDSSPDWSSIIPSPPTSWRILPPQKRTPRRRKVKRSRHLMEERRQMWMSQESEKHWKSYRPIRFLLLLNVLTNRRTKWWREGSWRWVILFLRRIICLSIRCNFTICRLLTYANTFWHLRIETVNTIEFWSCRFWTFSPPRACLSTRLRSVDLNSIPTRSFLTIPMPNRR